MNLELKTIYLDFSYSNILNIEARTFIDFTSLDNKYNLSLWLDMTSAFDKYQTPSVFLMKSFKKSESEYKTFHCQEDSLKKTLDLSYEGIKGFYLKKTKNFYKNSQNLISDKELEQFMQNIYIFKKQILDIYQDFKNIDTHEFIKKYKVSINDETQVSFVGDDNFKKIQPLIISLKNNLLNEKILFNIDTKEEHINKKFKI